MPYGEHMLRALGDDDSYRDCLQTAVVSSDWHDMGGPYEMPPSQHQCLESDLSAFMHGSHRLKEVFMQSR